MLFVCRQSLITGYIVIGNKQLFPKIFSSFTKVLYVEVENVALLGIYSREQKGFDPGMDRLVKFFSSYSD
jgi:hypothetical protein